MYPYYYQILEVPPDASQEEIRRAYRRLAKRWHPDVNRSPGAQEHFLLIRKAWEILGDPQHRAHYDYYAKRYTHRSDTTPPPAYRGPASDPAMRTRAYAGFGGRVYYRTADAATFEKEQKLRFRDMMAGLAVIIVIMLIPLIGRYWNQAMLYFRGNEAVAEVAAKDESLIFTFNNGGTRVISESWPKLFAVGGEMVVPHGMPVELGDRFAVRFLPGQPEVNRIKLEEPTEETFDRYCSMIYLRWASTPFLDSLSAGSMDAVFLFTLCDTLFSRFGVEGLANLYFAGVSPQINRYNNSATWGRMTRSPEWEPMLRQCREMTMPLPR